MEGQRKEMGMRMGRESFWAGHNAERARARQKEAHITERIVKTVEESRQGRAGSHTQLGRKKRTSQRG
jgi:hypothetical protein